MTARSPSPRGFTLLELIVSMAMVAMLSLSLYASMTIAFRARRSAQAAVAPARAASVVADLIARDFESVQPPDDDSPLRGPLTGWPAGSMGTLSDTIEFYSLGADGDALGPGGDGDGLPLSEGFRRIELSVIDTEQPPVLVRRVTRNLLSTTDQVDEEEVLCRGVRAFTIRYFDGYSWTEDWDPTVREYQLPRAVEVSLEIETPLPASGGATGISRVTRLIPIACAPPPDALAETTGGTP